MGKRVFLLISLCIIINLFSNSFLLAQEEEHSPRPSMGLTVQPGGLLVQYVPLGITYDFYESVRIPLIIHNKDIHPHTYLLSSHKPSQVGAKKWTKGYLEIPDTSWFWFEENEVTVEANNKAEVKMYLKIPDEERYYNQHWVVSLGIAGKPQPGSTIALAIYPRVEIETLSKEDVQENPDGSIGLVPSMLLLENLSLGKEDTMKLRIYNNDAKKQSYKITALTFPEDPRKRQIFPSPTYSWIPDTKWVKPGRKDISILSFKTKDIPIRVNIPKDPKNYNKRWEAIIFIESDKGLAGFARVQIKTERLK